MKVLIVCSGNSGKIAPFIQEQIDSLINRGLKIETFLIKGNSFTGYAKNILKLNKHINKNNYDLIHAHYGLSGLLSILQNKLPTVITYHGTDINLKSNRKFSYLASRRAKHNIYVSKELYNLLPSENFSIIPAGVNLKIFYSIPKDEARKKLKLRNNRKYVLFGSSFNIPIKNAKLAKKVINNIPKENIKLLELKKYSRGEVNLLLNAVDVAFLTSFAEGSPQFIKEAIAVNCPIVSTDVGDVKNLLGNISGHFLTSFDIQDVTQKLKHALIFSKKVDRTHSKNRIKKLGLDSENVAKEIIEVYKKVLSKK